MVQKFGVGNVFEESLMLIEAAFVWSKIQLNNFIMITNITVFYFNVF